MTITIADGRGALWQWDTGRRVKITDGNDVKQVHYQNKCFGRSVDVDVRDDGTAIIPDELLQDWHPLTAYAYVTDDTGAYTMVQQDFIVHKRAKPAGYVYTPTDQITLQTIQRQIGDLADLTTEAKDTLVAAINEVASAGNVGSMGLRVADGYIQYSTDSGSTWKNLIAVSELKGADGSKGDPGIAGQDGHSPVVTATKSGKTTTISVDGAAIATVEDGVDGKPGAAGADGVTPHIGDNGHWYLGGTDTGKPSRGETGAQGTPGKDGAGMDITGATVGQIAKIAAVDASGVPTAWSPADMPSGGSSDAVLYTAQELTYGQKFQARKNIEAAGRVMPTITGGVSLCPANVTDSNTAVHTTTTTAGGDDFTLTLDGGPENAPVRVKGIRTPTDADTDAAATVEYVKNKVTSGGSTDAVLYTAQTLTDAQKKQARENIDAASSDFVINGTLNNDALTSDKNYAQIQEAVQAGKSAVLKVKVYGIDFFIPLMGKNSSGYLFTTAATIFPTVTIKFTALVGASETAWHTERVVTCGSDGIIEQFSMDRDPSQPMEVATKQYVDNALDGKAGTAAATQSAAGLMSAADKAKLDGIERGANKTTVPTALKNPNALTIKIGSTTVTYDGSTAQTVTIADGTEVSY